MAQGYRVKTVKFQNGERFAFLIDSRVGAPMFEPTLFASKVLRAKARATNTIDQAMRSLLFFYQALDLLDVNLEERFNEMHFLEMSEMEEIVRLSHLSMKGLDEMVRICSAPVKTRAKVVNLESVRRTRANISHPRVESKTSAIRLGYIGQYLKWLSARRLMQFRHDREKTRELLVQVRLVLESLAAQMPSDSRERNTVGQREGLSPEMQDRLLDVIRPDSPENPWLGEHVRYRNQLLIHWLVAMALRKGEVLGVTTDDIDFRTDEVLVARRADNPEDPRTPQPLTKTLDRRLVMERPLALLTLQYINKYRRKLPGAKIHHILFLANGTGEPLSLSAVQKVFEKLRQKVPDLPEDLSAHVLRHTWNERFSEQMDEKGVSEADEKKWRNYINGWSDSGTTAGTYTRRHVRNAANKVLMAGQEAFLSKSKIKKEAP